MAQSISSEDRHFMELAVELGRRGWGRVQPNPMVGCVLVKDGLMVGEGWHEEFGGPHAETNALAKAGSAAQGATVYVSLEPCNHFGHTPPCSRALAEARVRRVVYGWPDPGKRSSGGAEALKAMGIEVEGPIFPPAHAWAENPAFFHNQATQSPYLAIKLAQSLDGRIAASKGVRTTITGQQARQETHRLRAGFQGVMVGSETVQVDDPLLTVREEVPHRSQPARIVLDSRLRTRPTARLFEDVHEAPVLIFTGESAPGEAMRVLSDAGAEIEAVPSGEDGLALDHVLAACWRRGLRSLFCEGGARLASSVILGGHAQRLYLFVAPFVLGSRGVLAFPESGTQEVWSRWAPAAPPALFGRDALLTLDRRN